MFASPFAPAFASPAPRPDEHDSDGEEDAVSDDESRPLDDADSLHAALEGEDCPQLSVASYLTTLQPAISAERREELVSWLTKARSLARSGCRLCGNSCRTARAEF